MPPSRRAASRASSPAATASCSALPPTSGSRCSSRWSGRRPGECAPWRCRPSWATARPRSTPAGRRWPTTSPSRCAAGSTSSVRQGIAAVHEAVTSGGLAARVLARPGGERHLTDLHHIGQMLHDVDPSRAARASPPCWSGSAANDAAIVAAASGRGGSRATPRRCRSSPSTAARVCSTRSSTCRCTSTATSATRTCRCSTTARTRMRHVGTTTSPEVAAAVRAEAAAEELRLTYVALTRAQSQVVAWWAPSWNAGRSGLTRLLLGREPGEPLVPQSIETPSPSRTHAARLAAWQSAGAIQRRAGRPDQRRHRPAERARAAGARRAHPRPADRHRLATHVVLRADPRGAGRCRPGQRAGGARHRRRALRRRLGGRHGGRAVARAGVRRPRRSGLTDGRAARRGRVRLARPRRAGARRRHACPTWRRSCSVTSPSSGAGGPSTSRPPTSPRPSCRCSSRRSDRWPATFG